VVPARSSRPRATFHTSGRASLTTGNGAQQWAISSVFLTSAPRPNSIEASYLSGFPHGMRELGYVEGRDYVIDWRFAEGRLERFADFAAELVRLNIDVFVLGTPTAVLAVQQATSTIPVVMGYSTDPVAMVS
jgi:putative ABC transport system substrate-binding protein